MQIMIEAKHYVDARPQVTGDMRIAQMNLGGGTRITIDWLENGIRHDFKVELKELLAALGALGLL